MTDFDTQVKTLLRLLLATRPEELDCDDFLDRVAGVYEALEEGAEPPSELEAVSQHLDVCPECREEYDALVRALGH